MTTIFKNTANSYGSGAKFFHWFIAVLIIAMLILGTSLHYIENTALRSSLIQFHKSVGLLILFVGILRISWRFLNIRTELPLHMPRWQKKLARLNHQALYCLIIAMPLSGWIMSCAANYTPRFFGLFLLPLPIAPNPAIASLFGTLHEILAWLLTVLISLHVMAVFYHQWIRKDSLFKRMWF